MLALPMDECKQVMRRRLGAAVPEDALVFEEHDPAHFVSLTRTKDWKYVLINSHAKLSSEVMTRRHASSSLCLGVCVWPATQ